MKDWSSWAMAKKSLKALLDLDSHLENGTPQIRKLSTLDFVKAVKMALDLMSLGGSAFISSSLMFSSHL